VALDPARLAAYGVTIAEVADALSRTSGDSGAGVLEVAGHEVIVRGKGYVRSIEPRPTVGQTSGRAGDVAQLGDVRFGPEPRRGIATLDDQGEVVGGVVVMRQGQNALTVIRGVKARLAEIARTLPPGVHIVPTYDRSTLIEGAVHTLTSRLVEEMVIVSLVILLFLFHLRSALIPILSLPVAVVLAFLPMHFQGLNANLMSLGGIAVAIGAMVDASIIMIENVHKRLEEWEAAGRDRPREAVIVHALQEGGAAVFFALLVIAVSFLPVFTLEAQEGRLFRPLAFTKTYVHGRSPRCSPSRSRPRSRCCWCKGASVPSASSRSHASSCASTRRCSSGRSGGGASCSAGAALLGPFDDAGCSCRSGSEFMPPLNEGTILYMPTAPPACPTARRRTSCRKWARGSWPCPRSSACSARSAARRRRPIPRRPAWSRP
jgi:Cu(I)/Ag(I) efflux system membrane protein CusA/SilA